MNKEMREILEQIEGKKVQAKALVSEDKIEDAKNMRNEIKILQDKFNVLKELEEENIEEVQNMTQINKKVDNKDAKIIAFNKAVLGKPLTEVENALVEKNGEDGGYLVPIEQQNQIKELKRELVSLKDYCNVIPVGSLSGSMPIEVGTDDELVDFDELEEINQSTIKFGQVKYELGNYGDIIPVSNSLLQDEKANLTGFVGKRFAKKAVRKENSKILEIVKTASKIEGSNDYKIIQTILNKNLDPSISDAAIIITNQTGFDYLDKLEDKNGRPLLTESLVKPGVKMFKGREIVRLTDKVLPNVKNDSEKEIAMPFYIGDLEEMVSFFDRGVYEMAMSKEAGFTKNATYLRLIERFDTKAIDKQAMVYTEINL